MFSFIFVYCYCLFCVSWIPSGIAQIAVFDVPVHDLFKMQHGNGWPLTLTVAEGHEAQMKVDVTVPGQEECLVTTPAGVHFEVKSPPSNRYEVWEENACGVIVTGMTMEDHGRWRLTSVRGNESVTGWTEVYVERRTASYNPSAISLQDGTENQSVDLSTIDNLYCLVTQPFSQRSLIPGHCNVRVNKTSRVLKGNWDVVLGLPGQIAELEYVKQVDVVAERLDVGFIIDTSNNKLNLFCNILHTDKNITFCRFQKTNSPAGFNVREGLSDGRHSYFGEGFSKRQCGISVENPVQQDYGTWRCSVGVQQWVGTTIVQREPKQALITVSDTSAALSSHRLTRQEGEPRTIFVQKDLSFTIMCNAEVSLKYCWFEHVNGSSYTPTPQASEEQPFWFTGESLQTGDCGITFLEASVDDEGTWLCHMGPLDQVGVEATEEFEVRVTGALAANRKEIAVVFGEPATLYCHSLNKPLDYCRFVSPNALGLSIDTSVTEANPILGRYYFTAHRDLDYGDCSLTILSVTEDDLGEWTCAAMVYEEILESNDVIMVRVEVNGGSSYRAGVIGMSVGIVALVFLLGGVLIYKKGLPNISFSNPFRRNPRRTEDLFMNSFSPDLRSESTSIGETPRSSSSSNDIYRAPAMPSTSTI